VEEVVEVEVEELQEHVLNVEKQDTCLENVRILVVVEGVEIEVNHREVLVEMIPVEEHVVEEEEDLLWVKAVKV
jgi:hypothetical protein